MSTAVENPELEAAIAEAELTDEEAERVRELVAEGGLIVSAIPFVLSERETPDEPDEPDEPPDELGSEPSREQLKKLDAEMVRHEKRVHEVMGAFVEGFVACEGCGGVGLVAPGPPAPEPRTHEWFKTCETCAGFGQVLTGSLRNGQHMRDCPGCKGRGYLEALDGTGAPLADQSSAVATAPTMPAPVEQPAVTNGDGAPVSFGTPPWMGDPAIGR